MAADSPDSADRAVVVLTTVALVGALYACWSAFEPTDLAGLAVQYGAFLGAAAIGVVVLVRVAVPTFDDDEPGDDSRVTEWNGGEPVDDSPAAEWGGDWGVSLAEVVVAIGLAALLVAGGRASLAAGPVAAFVFLPFVIAGGAAAGWWLYAPETGRAAAGDHPFISPRGVVRRQIRVFGNLVLWVTFALFAALFGVPAPDGIPAAAFPVAALLALAVTHWLLTRPLVRL